MTTVRCGRPPRDLPSKEFEARSKRLCASLARDRLDAVLVVTEISRYYFTGLHASNGLLLVQRLQPPVFYTDFRYLTMARRGLTFMAAEKLWRPADEQDVLSKIGKTWKRVGYEGQMDAARFNSLKAALPGVEWIDVSERLAAMRSVKSLSEQRLVRAAVAMNDRLFSEILKQISPGVSEWDVRNLVRGWADRLGQGEAFETIACVGRNAAECHHHPDETVLKKGQSLLIDLGVKVDHYCSDMTRSVFFGSPTSAYRAIHTIVLEANRKAIRAIRPGRRCDEIDALARGHIERAGYGTCFGHGLGHSLGLEIHESPSFSPSCKTELKPGMILTVEPGIYLPGRLGIRIEDVVLVTRTGCEVLSQTPREWVVA